LRNNDWHEGDEDGFDNSEGIIAEDRGFAQNLSGRQNDWEAWVGHSLKTMVGEYNINRNIATQENGLDIGVHGASFILEHMANMIEAGVAVTFSWPIGGMGLHHRPEEILAFRSEEIIRKQYRKGIIPDDRCGAEHRMTDQSTARSARRVASVASCEWRSRKIERAPRRSPRLSREYPSNRARSRLRAPVRCVCARKKATALA